MVAAQYAEAVLELAYKEGGEAQANTVLSDIIGINQVKQKVLSEYRFLLAANPFWLLNLSFTNQTLPVASQFVVMGIFGHILILKSL